MKRIIGIAFVIAIITTVVFLYISRGKKEPLLSSKTGLNPLCEVSDEMADGVGQKVLSFNLEGYRDNGQKKWELNGACANILTNVIKLDYITAKAYGDEGSLTLKAKKGMYDKTTRDIVLEENVVGKTSDGTRLITDKLYWKGDEERVMTNSLVRIDKGNLISVGRGAVGSPALKQVELKKNVSVKLREDPSTLITCDGPLVVNYKKNISTLYNNVKIVDDRGEIYADVMKILFNPKTRKIVKVIAIGNVRIDKEGNTTYSEKAVYTVKDGRVRLIGKPKIVVFPKEGKENASTGDKGIN